MKFKYYLRGLGIGIIVTAVVMSTAISNKNEAMTDEQVKARAVELGMIEDTFLADAVKKMEETREAKEASAEQTTKTTAEQTSEALTEQTSKTPAEQTSEAATENGTNSDPEEGKPKIEMIEISVGNGESSVSISKKLEEAGLVDSAAEYDRYLSRNGYDKKICTGNHMIARGATNEEIAREITTRQ